MLYQNNVLFDAKPVIPSETLRDGAAQHPLTSYGVPKQLCPNRNERKVQMKGVLALASLFLLSLMSGCASTSQVLRPAPREGVQVAGLNVLFSIVPLDAVIKPGANGTNTTERTGARQLTAPREEAEKLRDEIGQRLIPQLRDKGLTTSYASVQIIPGVMAVPISQLFPDEVGRRHLLVITPISERKTCNGASCSTVITVSLSLRTPIDNKEIWNLRLEQGLSGANWIANRNHVFIDDIGKSILEVIVPMKGSGGSSV